MRSSIIPGHTCYICKFEGFSVVMRILLDPVMDNFAFENI